MLVPREADAQAVGHARVAREISPVVIEAPAEGAEPLLVDDAAVRRRGDRRAPDVVGVDVLRGPLRRTGAKPGLRQEAARPVDVEDVLTRPLELRAPLEPVTRRAVSGSTRRRVSMVSAVRTA